MGVECELKGVGVLLICGDVGGHLLAVTQWQRWEERSHANAVFLCFREQRGWPVQYGLVAGRRIRTVYTAAVGVDGIDVVHQPEQLVVAEHRPEGIPDTDTHFSGVV